MKTLLLLISFLVALQHESVQAEETLVYGADVSYPMHYLNVTINYPWLEHNVNPEVPTPPEYEGMVIQPLGDKQTFYNNLIQGCVDHYGKKGSRCIHNEIERVDMSLRQPQSMVNYTKMGFTKIRAPPTVFKLLQEFWEANKDKAKVENWPPGNTYVNHWDQPTSMVSVEDTSLVGGGYVLKQHIWNAAKDTISAWTGQQLVQCSLYGIRIYKEGAVLAPHVDRLPLVSSAIINVDQDVDEPWPLEVIGHDGKAHNVTMVPGDLVLYESHSILHGRPFPLKGRYMANVFIHFEPVGLLGQDNAGHSALPPYLIPGSPEEPNWRSRNPKGHTVMKEREFETGTTEAHGSVIDNDIVRLSQVLDGDPTQLNSRDSNGWTPLHYAVRSGRTEMVQFLLDRGADVNARSGAQQTGGSPLWWAEYLHKEKADPVARVLAEYGGKNYGPNSEL